MAGLVFEEGYSTIYTKIMRFSILIKIARTSLCMNRLDRILANNHHWARSMVAQDPQFFQSLVGVQKPEYLWIGCSDSRVPANEIIGLKPGEIFVHRNVANIVSLGDMNVLAVIYYAVEILEVKEIIVTGHYGCGGIQSSFTPRNLGPIEFWLYHIRELKHTYQDILQGSREEQAHLLTRLNVQQQVLNVGRIPIVQKAWALGKTLNIHGLVYNLSDGILKDLGVTLSKPSDIPDTFRLQV